MIDADANSGAAERSRLGVALGSAATTADACQTELTWNQRLADESLFLRQRSLFLYFQQDPVVILDSSAPHGFCFVSTGA